MAKTTKFQYGDDKTGIVLTFSEYVWIIEVRVFILNVRKTPPVVCVHEKRSIANHADDITASQKNK